jgi:hypothetical protein
MGTRFPLSGSRPKPRAIPDDQLILTETSMCFIDPFRLLLFILLAAFISAWPVAAQTVLQDKSLTILVNGFGSALPTIGYGFKKLQSKIPNAKLYSYVGAVEGWTYIAPKVLSDVRTAYRENPDIKINLVGASFGANLLTRVAAKLNQDGIPISYLGIIDGLPLAPITPNVWRVDNFRCSYVGCLRDKIELTDGNTNTIPFSFDYKSTHVGLTNRAEVHRRILRQLESHPMDIVTFEDKDPSICEEQIYAGVVCSEVPPSALLPE